MKPINDSSITNIRLVRMEKFHEQWFDRHAGKYLKRVRPVRHRESDKGQRKRSQQGYRDTACLRTDA